MKVWISTVGWSSFAVINPLWAACFFENELHFVPEKVVLLNNAGEDPVIKKNLEIVKPWIIRILKEYGINEPEIESVEANEGNMNDFVDVFNRIIKKYRDDQIAIDMTPGRKFMSSIAMNIAVKHQVEKLFYLQLWGREYLNRPFIMIPFPNQKLINILEFLKNNE
jgi:hypothetical protein